MTDRLTELLLAKPIGPAVQARPGRGELTRQVEVKGTTAEVTVNSPGPDVDQAAGYIALEANGLNVAEWEATTFRTSEWTMANGETGTSTRWGFKRVDEDGRLPLDLDGMFAAITAHTPAARRPDGDHGFLVALGDMQFGKVDGDGVDGTLRRTVEGIDRARDLLETYRQRFDIGHVHVAWLGDHVEGFVSQGGANTWRTVLTLNEQIRLTRRVMLHALTTFADSSDRVSMAAVPGNHGEPQRFMGKGVTRYDDSHDTESLVAVADAAGLNAAAFGHVEFLVPDTDEMTVVLDVAGTRVGHVHGHQFKTNKHFDWWSGQAFNPASNLRDADLLLAGHLHHEHIEGDGERLFIQVPAMESESTWWRHAKGVGGNPGLIVAVTKDGRTSPIEVSR